MKYIKIMNTKIGTINIIEEEKKIIAVEINQKTQYEATPKNTELLKETQKHLDMKNILKYVYLDLIHTEPNHISYRSL